MLDEDQRVPDVEPEPPATVGDQSQDLRFVREAAAQQNQPGLEVVLDIRQLEAPVRRISRFVNWTRCSLS
jgi:hypothetical protein